MFSDFSIGATHNLKQFERETKVIFGEKISIEQLLICMHLFREVCEEKTNRIV